MERCRLPASSPHLRPLRTPRLVDSHWLRPTPPSCTREGVTVLPRDSLERAMLRHTIRSCISPAPLFSAGLHGQPACPPCPALPRRSAPPPRLSSAVCWPHLPRFPRALQGHPLPQPSAAALRAWHLRYSGLPLAVLLSRGFRRLSAYSSAVASIASKRRQRGCGPALAVLQARRHLSAAGLRPSTPP